MDVKPSIMEGESSGNLEERVILSLYLFLFPFKLGRLNSVLWCVQGTPEDASRAVNGGSNDPSVDPDEEVCLSTSIGDVNQ